MQQGDARSTSLVNWTSAIFFSPMKYRAIRPADGASLLGFVSVIAQISYVPQSPLTSAYQKGTNFCGYLHNRYD